MRRSRRRSTRGDEAEARSILEQVNDRIRYVNSHTVSGPPSTVWVVDVDSILERRRLVGPEEPATVISASESDGAAVAAASVVRGRRRFRWSS